MTFPRSEINRVELPYNMFHNITSLDNRIVLTTGEAHDNSGASLLFELTPDLRVSRMSTSDSYWLKHRALEQEGRLKHSAKDCPDLTDAKILRTWTRDAGWTMEEVRMSAAMPGHTDVR